MVSVCYVGQNTANEGVTATRRSWVTPALDQNSEVSNICLDVYYFPLSAPYFPMDPLHKLLILSMLCF